MRVSEFVKELRRRGVRITNGRNHYLAEFMGRFAAVPRHPAKEIKTGTRIAILRQLGLRERE